MKKIIMTTGTSLFENYMEDRKDDINFRNYVEDLMDRDGEEYDTEKSRTHYLNNKINEWLKNKTDKTNASAEIKSLVKLKEELKDDFEIYLLCSDTVLSRLAGEILKEKLSDIQSLNPYHIYCYKIDNIQVKNMERFKYGMCNLINRIYHIAASYWANIVINITSGYKATIPYLTILAQVNKCPIYYIFEGTDALIKIPYIPQDINWKVFEENENFFMRLERTKIEEIPSGINYREEVESLIERVDNLISLNPLGITLWEKYKERYDIFYISEIVDDYIERSKKDYEEICKKSFLELKRRLQEEPHHPDLNHSLSIDLKGFKCFKHKEENLQVRILYKVVERETRYRIVVKDIYIGIISIGSEVHNADSEYVESFKMNINKISNLEAYSVYKIEKESEG